MIILIDKPSGYTSFDIIRKLQKLYPKTKIGHGGTLDPLATGLLIIALGKDTKKLNQIIGKDKTYIASIDFSAESDTWDYDYYTYFKKFDIIKKENQVGILKDNKFIPAPNIKEIKQKLNLILGEKELPLPTFSAKKIKGKKLYELARKGENINLSKKMKIINYEILNYNFPYLKLKLKVGSGTYIRSIAYWLGKQFDLGGILKDLRRIKIGEYEIR